MSSVNSPQTNNVKGQTQKFFKHSRIYKPKPQAPATCKQPQQFPMQPPPQGLQIPTPTIYLKRETPELIENPIGEIHVAPAFPSVLSTNSFSPDFQSKVTEIFVPSYTPTIQSLEIRKTQLNENLAAKEAARAQQQAKKQFKSSQPQQQMQQQQQQNQRKASWQQRKAQQQMQQSQQMQQMQQDEDENSSYYSDYSEEESVNSSDYSEEEDSVEFCNADDFTDMLKEINDVIVKQRVAEKPIAKQQLKQLNEVKAEKPIAKQQLKQLNEVKAEKPVAKPSLCSVYVYNLLRVAINLGIDCDFTGEDDIGVIGIRNAEKFAGISIEDNFETFTSIFSDENEFTENIDSDTLVINVFNHFRTHFFTQLRDNTALNNYRAKHKIDSAYNAFHAFRSIKDDAVVTEVCNNSALTSFVIDELQRIRQDKLATRQYPSTKRVLDMFFNVLNNGKDRCLQYCANLPPYFFDAYTRGNAAFHISMQLLKEIIAVGEGNYVFQQFIPAAVTAPIIVAAQPVKPVAVAVAVANPSAANVANPSAANVAKPAPQLLNNNFRIALADNIVKNLNGMEIDENDDASLKLKRETHNFAKWLRSNKQITIDEAIAEINHIIDYKTSFAKLDEIVGTAIDAIDPQNSCTKSFFEVQLESCIAILTLKLREGCINANAKITSKYGTFAHFKASFQNVIDFVYNGNVDAEKKVVFDGFIIEQSYRLFTRIILDVLPSNVKACKAYNYDAIEMLDKPFFDKLEANAKIQGAAGGIYRGFLKVFDSAEMFNCMFASLQDYFKTLKMPAVLATTEYNGINVVNINVKAGITMFKSDYNVAANANINYICCIDGEEKGKCFEFTENEKTINYRIVSNFVNLIEVAMKNAFTIDLEVLRDAVNDYFEIVNAQPYNITTIVYAAYSIGKFDVSITDLGVVYNTLKQYKYIADVYARDFGIFNHYLGKIIAKDLSKSIKDNQEAATMLSKFSPLHVTHLLRRLRGRNAVCFGEQE